MTKRFGPVVVLTLALSGPTMGSQRGPLLVAALANEGFLLEAEGSRVLVDALFRAGVDGYAAPSPGLRQRLESAAPPFGGAAFVLATHHHADHFDPVAVAAYLDASPRSRFVSTRQSMARLRAVPGAGATLERAEGLLPAEGARAVREHDGVTVQVLNVHHGRDRPIENLGLLVEVGGYRVLHLGDAEATAAELRALGLAAERLDVFFVPYWYVMHDDGRNAVRETGAHHVVLMHAPRPGLDQAVDHAGGFQALVERTRQWLPNVVWLEGEERRIELR